MRLDDPAEREEFIRGLRRLGAKEVKYRLNAGKYNARKAAVVQQWLEDESSGANIGDDISDVAAQLEALKSQFVTGDWGMFLQTENQAAFERLFLEAKSLTDEALGRGNDYSRMLINHYNEGVGGVHGGPSLACVSNIKEVLLGAAKQTARRSNSQTSATNPTQGFVETYISEDRISELRNIQSAMWDTRRLLRLCEEINSVFAAGNYIATALLVRAVIDHVPPIFGQPNFKSVAAQHGGRSFKEAMGHLELSMRKIADAFLHEPIREKESVPNSNTVDTKRDLDFLLGEVCRIL